MCSKNIVIAGIFLFLNVIIFSLVKEHKDHKQQKGVPGYSSVTIDPERVQLLGITSEKIIFRHLKKDIRTVGIVDVDETKISHIQTKFKGWIEDLYVNFIGMPVGKGDRLFSVYSPELFSTQEEYISALQELENSIEGKFSKEYRESNLSLANACKERLRLWDISEEQIFKVEKERRPYKTLDFKSPVKGIVLTKKAFLGMNVSPGMTMYSIADLSQVWVLADIYENDIDLIKLGQKADITFSSFPGQIFKAKSTFIDYVVERSTRTAKVRFELNNSDFKLKPGMFATVNLNIDMGIFLALPQEALIDTGIRKIVFIDKGKGHFEPRQVEIGFKAGPYYQILSGVSEGQKVVTSAQFLLDSESRLTAVAKNGMRGHGY